jgi:hypothetical protein
MPEKKRVTYTELGEPKVVCVPEGGFPLERLRRYIERCKRERLLTPQEVRDFVVLLCDDELISALSAAERQLVKEKVRPTVSAFLQPRARAIREARKLN